MSIRRRLAGACRALLLAASVTALSVAAARAQDTDTDLRDLNDRILQNPQDAELNLRYARLAEQLGKLRLALAAYERVLINNPDNEDAQLGFSRVRRALEPSYTSLRVEIGGQWDANPLNMSGSDEEAFSVFGRATLVDERRFGSRRWRTTASFDGELVPDIDELNYAYMGVQTGPIMDIAPHLAAVPALGVAVAALDNAYYFDEINLGVTLEGQRRGVSFWTRTRAGWRSYSETSTAEEGAQAEVALGVSIPRIASRSDALTIVPWARWSGVEGSAFDFLNEEIAPGEYSEFGMDVNYHHQFNDHVIVSTGALAYGRRFSRTEIAGEERRDVYVSPQATITFQNFMPCQCALKTTYRYRTNDSNDPFADYDAHQASVSLVTRFW